MNYAKANFYLLLLVVAYAAEAFGLSAETIAAGLPSVTPCADRPATFHCASRIKIAQNRSTAPNPADDDVDLEITVIGTRTPRAIQDSPSTVTVLTEQEVNNNFIQNAEDAIRYEPGISVNNRPARSGNGSFNIRGLDGNRVLILVDGIRIPDLYNVSSRDLFEFDTLRRLEIVRGPASTLYGSDALGGVVAYTTKNPQDYLQGRPQTFQTRLTYNSADHSFSPTVTLASQSGNAALSATYTRRDGSETLNGGNIPPNPQTIVGNNGIVKFQLQPNPQNEVLLTGEFFNRRTNTRVNSNIGPVGSPTIFRTAQTANDIVDRNRYSIAYNYNNPTGSGFIQQLQSTFYYQAANTHEEVEEFRTVTAGGSTSNRRRFAINDFRQNIIGTNVQLQSGFNTGNWQHRLTYGFDLTNTNTSRPRDNTEFNLTANTSTKNVAGELFPNKTFPNTDTTRFGFYIQDEITAGNFNIIPGIRFDTYSMNPQTNDPDFIRIGGRVEDVKPLNESAISPRLGIVYKVSPSVSVTAQYSRGFRSPPYDDAAIAFTNFAFGYTVIPNANLRPETSDGFEIGLRTNTPNFNSSFSAFYNRYNNFIDTVGTGTVVIQGRNFNQFQAQNIGSAEIIGLEAKGEYRFSNRNDGFSLLGSLAFTQGTNLQTSQPINSIDPLKAIVGLRYRAPEDRWGVDLTTTLVSGKTNVDSTGVAAGQTLFLPAGYTTLDLTGYYNFNPNTRLNVGLFNLLGEKYTRWSDVRGLTTADRNLGLYVQPGLTLATSLSVQF
jgi:hemoglobin/transferrin/lactoferrin receptor protein